MNYLLINVREYRRDNQQRGQSIDIGNIGYTRLAIHTNLFKNLRTFNTNICDKDIFITNHNNILYKVQDYRT